MIKIIFSRATDKRTLGDMSMLEDSAATSARMTPTKFSISHAYGMIFN